MATEQTDQAATPLPLGLPAWTELGEQGGLDPLGMQNTSITLYQSLLPGISNITLRMRYYGFYAWLVSVYAREKRVPNKKVWQVFVRRAEALLALTVAHHGEEAGVAGIEWARKRHSAAEKSAETTIDFRHDALPPSKGDSKGKYLKQAMGVFGAAYATQMTVLDILSTADKHDIAVPSAASGDALAAAFKDTLGPVAERFIQAIDHGKVSLEALEGFKVLLPSAIVDASTERQLYEDLLFARTGPQTQQDIARRESLALVLSVTQQSGATPSPESFRWALYAGFLPDGAPLHVSPKLEMCRSGWWAYQLNDLSHVCFATLLSFALERLSEYPDGIPLERLLADLVKEIVEAAPSPPATWAYHLQSMPPVPNAWTTDEDHADYRLAKTLLALNRKQSVCKASDAWAAIQLLGVLYQRAGERRETVSRYLGGKDSEIFRSVHTEMAFLDPRLDQPFVDTLHELLERRVIQRHLWIALRKLRYQKDYTYLLEVDDGRVRQRDHAAPVLTNPRLGPSLTFLRDIHLVDDKALTLQGKRCLKEWA